MRSRSGRRCLGRLALPTLLALFGAPAAAESVSRVSPEPLQEPAASDTEEPLDPLRVTAAMREFLAEKIPPRVGRLGRLQALMDALFDPADGLGVVYGSNATRSAAGTFETAEGNCLSFTLLFVTLARELDLDAHFVEVGEVVGWSRRGPTTFGHWHIYVEATVDNRLFLVDFLPVEERRYFQSRRIGDSRVRAHYLNNLGAEALASGSLELALERFRAALALDDTFTPARVNLAAALRRSGDPAAAERALRELLWDDPRNAQGATNLAALLTEQGRLDEAALWQKQASQYLERNPFHHFRLAVSALERGEADAAREHLRAAIRRRPDEPLFHERMADVLVRLERVEDARRSLEKAVEYESDPDRRAALRERLGALGATGTGAAGRGAT